MTCIHSTARFSQHRDMRGFTLVELIVVILITGILAVSVAPRFFGTRSYEDRKAVDELLTALRHTQQMAMTRGGNIQLVLTTNGFTVQMSNGTQLRSPDGRIPYSRSFPTAVTINPTATITYDRLGRPDAGYVISVGSQQVTVEQETGYAH